MLVKLVERRIIMNDKKIKELTDWMMKKMEQILFILQILILFPTLPVLQVTHTKGF